MKMVYEALQPKGLAPARIGKIKSSFYSLRTSQSEVFLLSFNSPTGGELVMAENRSADIMLMNVLEDGKLTQDQKTDLEPVLRKAATDAKKSTPLTGDLWIYRMVVGFLGVTVITVTIGAIALSFTAPNTSTPDSIVALGSAAIGALAGLLAPSPTR